MRERHRPERGGTPAAGDDGLLDRRPEHEAAERLVAEGADVIERALSKDSLAFLDANQQEGGQ